MIKYLACIYSATGEGHITLLLVTNALCPTAEFTSLFSGYYKPTELSKDEFMLGYGELVPSEIIEMCNNEPDCFFSWNSALHLNYS